jgi:hypothetical protein
MIIARTALGFAITSNRGVDEWLTRFDDPLLGNGALDRLAGRAPTRQGAELPSQTLARSTVRPRSAAASSIDEPMREGSRDAQGGCLVCGKDTPSTRAKYCGELTSGAITRLRHQTPTADLTTVRKALQRRKALVDHTIYECGQCGERFVAARRCESCNRFCAALGPGGACPDCDRPILVDDLLGEGVFTRA